MRNPYYRIFLALSFTLLMANGCTRDDMQTGSRATSNQMQQETDLNLIYEAAINDPRRPAEDVARDAGRKPAEIIKFFGIKPGMRIIDNRSGTGYFSRIFSVIVGTEGSVVAHNNGPRMNDRLINDDFKAEMLEQYSSYGNVEVNYENLADMSYPDNSVDVVFVGLVFHHWHHSEESGEFIPQSSLDRLDNIMRMLKPGGVLAIIDHEAAEGMSREASDAIHRIPRATAVEDITLAGFEFIAESDIHANHPDDDMTIRWTRDPRDATRRIVQLYRKPI